MTPAEQARIAHFRRFVVDRLFERYFTGSVQWHAAEIVSRGPDDLGVTFRSALVDLEHTLTTLGLAVLPAAAQADLVDNALPLRLWEAIGDWSQRRDDVAVWETWERAFLAATGRAAP
jgi:hypothetical protein